MFLDASASGSLKNKTDHEVQALIENMACNEYRAEAAKKRGVFGMIDQTAILANQATMNKQLETLTKEFHGFTMANKQQVAAIRCDYVERDMQMVSVYLKEVVRKPTIWVTIKSQILTTIQALTNTLILVIQTTTPCILCYLTLNNSSQESLPLLRKL